MIFQQKAWHWARDCNSAPQSFMKSQLHHKRSTCNSTRTQELELCFQICNHSLLCLGTVLVSSGIQAGRAVGKEFKNGKESFWSAHSSVEAATVKLAGVLSPGLSPDLPIYFNWEAGGHSPSAAVPSARGAAFGTEPSQAAGHHFHP